VPDIALDLETMGTCADAAIVAIGAVTLDAERGTIGERFEVIIDLEDAVRHGGVMDAQTVLWWMRQDDAARALFAKRKGETLKRALFRFSAWMAKAGPRKTLRVWGDGSDFDNVILSAAYRRAGVDLPWEWWNNRCYRTLRKLHPDSTCPQIGIAHSAVDDAESAARHLLELIPLTGRQRP